MKPSRPGPRQCEPGAKLGSVKDATFEILALFCYLYLLANPIKQIELKDEAIRQPPAADAADRGCPVLASLSMLGPSGMGKIATPGHRKPTPHPNHKQPSGDSSAPTCRCGCRSATDLGVDVGVDLGADLVHIGCRSGANRVPKGSTWETDTERASPPDRNRFWTVEHTIGIGDQRFLPPTV